MILLIEGNRRQYTLCCYLLAARTSPRLKMHAVTVVTTATQGVSSHGRKLALTKMYWKKFLSQRTVALQNQLTMVTAPNRQVRAHFGDYGKAMAIAVCMACLMVLTGWGEEHRRYPVLYLQDGQNVFSSAGPNIAFGWGSWELDKTADELCRAGKMQDIILAAVDNNPPRYPEY